VTGSSVATPPAGPVAGPAGTVRPGRDLCGLVLLACGTSALGAALRLTSWAGAPWPPISADVQGGLYAVAGAVAGVWLMRRVSARPAGSAAGYGAAALTAAVSGARVLATVLDHKALEAISLAAFTALLCWLVVELGRPYLPEGKRALSGHARETVLTTALFLALCVAAWITVQARTPVRTVVGQTAPWALPPLPPKPLADLDDRLHYDAYCLFTSVIEELVLVGAVVVLGRAAGWGLPAIAAVSLGARLAIHLHYGAAAITMIILGAVALGLFLRYRRIEPLVAAHMTFDLMAPLMVARGWL